MADSNDKGREFEERIGAYFSTNGYDVELNVKLVGRSGATHEIDVLAKKSDGLVAIEVGVECKAWDLPIEKDVVYKTAGVATDIGLNKVLIASAAGWRSGAETVAGQLGVELWGPDQLRMRIGDVVSLAPEMSGGTHGVGFLDAPPIFEVQLNERLVWLGRVWLRLEEFALRAVLGAQGPCVLTVETLSGSGEWVNVQTRTVPDIGGWPEVDLGDAPVYGREPAPGGSITKAVRCLERDRGLCQRRAVRAGREPARSTAPISDFDTELLADIVDKPRAEAQAMFWRGTWLAVAVQGVRHRVVCDTRQLGWERTGPLLSAELGTFARAIGLQEGQLNLQASVEAGTEWEHEALPMEAVFPSLPSVMPTQKAVRDLISDLSNRGGFGRVVDALSQFEDELNDPPPGVRRMTCPRCETPNDLPSIDEKLWDQRGMPCAGCRYPLQRGFCQACRTFEFIWGENERTWKCQNCGTSSFASWYTRGACGLCGTENTIFPRATICRCGAQLHKVTCQRCRNLCFVWGGARGRTKWKCPSCSAVRVLPWA